MSKNVDGAHMRAIRLGERQGGSLEASDWRTKNLKDIISKIRSRVNI
jgi:hypothetical protein